MESKDKTIEIYDPLAAEKYKEGDAIVVSMPGSMGHKAVLWAFIVPFLLLVVTIFGVMYFTHDEAWAALSGVGILVPYYGAVYLLRHKISEQFVFKVDV